MLTNVVSLYEANGPVGWLIASTMDGKGHALNNVPLSTWLLKNPAGFRQEFQFQCIILQPSMQSYELCYHLNAKDKWFVLVGCVSVCGIAINMYECNGYVWLCSLV